MRKFLNFNFHNETKWGYAVSQLMFNNMGKKVFLYKVVLCYKSTYV
jgi:hypothetical protein